MYQVLTSGRLILPCIIWSRYCPNSACAEHKPRFAHIIDNDTKPRERESPN